MTKRLITSKPIYVYSFVEKTNRTYTYLIKTLDRTKTYSKQKDMRLLIPARWYIFVIMWYNSNLISLGCMTYICWAHGIQFPVTIIRIIYYPAKLSQSENVRKHAIVVHRSSDALEDLCCNISLFTSWMQTPVWKVEASYLAFSPAASECSLPALT